jgi:hypothetical protein
MTDTVDVAIYKLSYQGIDQVNAATTALDRQVVSEERRTAATRISADSMDRLLARLDPRIKAEQQLQTVLARVAQFEDEGVGSMAQRAQAQALAVERYNTALARLGSPAAVSSITQVAKATEMSTFAMQNLSFQINDIAQGLATGQSPFRVMIQQGSQIAQLFGPGVGIGAALRVLGTSIGTFFLNPINLAVVAIGGASAAIETLWNAVGGGVQVEDVLRRHKQLVDEIAGAYGGATAAAKNYGHEAERVLQFQAQEAAKVLRAQLLADEQDALGSLYGSTGALRTTPQGIAIFDHLQESIKQGRVGILQFRQDLVDFGNSIPIAGLDAFGQHLPKADMQALIDKTLQATKALADMELQLQRTKSPSTILGPALDEGDGRSGSAETRLFSADVQAAIAAQERIKGVTDALAFQSAQLGRTARDQAIYNSLQQAGVTINTAAGQRIAAAAGALYDQQAAFQKASEAAGFFGDSIYDAMDGLIFRGNSANDVLKNLVTTLGEAVLRAELLGEGQIGGMFGTPVEEDCDLAEDDEAAEPAPPLVPDEGIAAEVWA